MENLQSEWRSLKEGFDSLYEELNEHKFNFLNLDKRDNFIEKVTIFCDIHGTEVNELNKNFTNMKNKVKLSFIT